MMGHDLKRFIYRELSSAAMAQGSLRISAPSAQGRTELLVGYTLETGREKPWWRRVTVRNGDKVRLSDVARAAGVSLGTVSNTLNRPHTVSEQTRKKVLAAIKKLDFVPNEGAASLRSGTSRMLGLVIPDVTNPIYAEITKGVAVAAEAAGYAVMLFNTDDQPDRELRQLEMLARHRSAGALIVPRKADDHRLERLRNLGLHLVLIDRAASEHDGCSVSIDDVRGGLLATSHLLASGRRKIAFVSGPVLVPQAAGRLEGLRRALVQAKLDPGSCIEIDMEDTSYADGELAASRIAEMSDPPDGVFCINDQLAIGVLRGLIRAGISVPAEISVVGYGDSAIAESAPVPLTTVRQPMFDLGRAAVGQLLSEVDESREEHHHSSTVFVPCLVIRSSAPQIERSRTPSDE